MAKKRVGKKKADGLLAMAQIGYESAKNTVENGIEAVGRKLGSVKRSAKKAVVTTKRRVSKAGKTTKAAVKAKVKTAKTKVKAATKRK